MVTVEGIVSASFFESSQLGGFFLQSHRDNEPRAGIFVYDEAVDTPWRSKLKPGAWVQIRAQVDDYKSQRQLKQVDWVGHCGVQTLAPAQLQDLSDLPKLDGQLVRIDKSLIVTGNDELVRYGSLTLASQRLFKPDKDSSRLMLDDGSYRIWPKSIPYLNEQATRRVGDQLEEGLIGVITHAFGSYRLHPVSSPQFVTLNPRPATPSAPLPGYWRAASFNLENYLITPKLRGAGDAKSLLRKRATAVATLRALNADLLALQEVENKPEAVAELVTRLNAEWPEGQHYAAVAADRSWGDDEIRVALLYRPARLRLEKTLPPPENGQFTRWPSAASFTAIKGSQPFTAAVVHLKSKAGCPKTGEIDEGQGCWNSRRLGEVRALTAYLADHADSGRALIMGDFNSYPDENPMQNLWQSGWHDPVAAKMTAQENYSYVHKGVSGRLDYLLATGGLEREVTNAQIWHINADEPDAPASSKKSEEPISIYRSSDHDPLFVDIRN